MSTMIYESGPVTHE